MSTRRRNLETMGQRPRSTFRAFGGWLLIIAAFIVTARSAYAFTALDDYVAAPDPSFSATPVFSTPLPGFRVDLLDMTSQTWRSASEVNRTEWQHYVTIITPDVLLNDTAMLFVDGGNNSSTPPALGDSGYDQQIGFLSQMALGAGSVVVHLPTIPNEPLTFLDDGIPRTEDGIISYTLDKYLNEHPNLGDNTWPLLLPMVKSAVRAMDVAQSQVPSINDFVVAGGSKRGWTTWLTAAVDARVKAVIPASIDFLNLDEQLLHHKEVYEGVTDFTVGGYSAAIGDYVAYDIPARLNTPAGQDLLEIIDPYEYRDRLTMPKYLLNSAGDEFFPSDSMQFYFDELSGQNLVRYVPNTGHGQNDEAIQSAAFLFAAFANDLPLPEYSWTVEDGGNTISAMTSDTPLEVLLWQASNPDSQDFRYGEGLGPGGTPFGPTWSSTPLTDQGGGVYVGAVPTPATGATAFMLEFKFPSGAAIPYTFTTEISVVTATPEPTALTIASCGLIGFCAYTWRRRRRT